MQISTTVNAIPDGADATATLQGQMYSCRLLRVVINGPTGSRADVYLGHQRIDQTGRASSNTAEYVNPVDVASGMPVSVKWTGQSANSGQCLATFTVDR